MMKNLKKLASIALALVMALSLAVPAFAANPSGATSGTSASTKGSISITNTLKDAEYSVYQLFELESYNNESGTFAYKVLPAWKSFVTGEGAGAAYVDVNEQDYVTWKADVSTDADTAAEFAQKALAYATEKEIAPAAPSQTASEDGAEIVFNNLPLGYYLVDSSVGALCSLDTTNQNVQIAEKNTKPGVDKEVQEDANGSWGKTNGAEVGETVNFKSTVTVGKGVDTYVLHDKMSAGLSFVAGSVEVAGVKVNDKGEGRDENNNLLWTVKSESLADGCTFEVEFEDSFIKTYDPDNTDNNKFEVTYSAILNDQAVIFGGENTNETHLDYNNGDGETWHTPDSETKTYSFKFDLVKTNGDGTPLDGAVFQLFITGDAENAILLVKGADNTYRVATSEQKAEYAAMTDEDKAASDYTYDITVTGGFATIEGLDEDNTPKYQLVEVEAPAGYNKLKDPVVITFNGSNIIANDADGNGYYVQPDTSNNSTDTGVIVRNLTGAEMPSTGGIGTTIFYTVGGLMVVAAGILLVTKRRMENK